MKKASCLKFKSDIKGNWIMVTFLLETQDEQSVIYRYFPEGKKESPYGLISVNLETGKISVDVVAEDDWLDRATAKELNDMRDCINRDRIERGEEPLSEDESPIATEDEEWYYYADMAIHKIRRSISEGTIPKEGVVIWY